MKKEIHAKQEKRAKQENHVKHAKRAKDEKQQKPTIWRYLNRYKWAVLAYIFLSAISVVGEIGLTLLTAQGLVYVTAAEYWSAVYLCLVVVGLYVVLNVIWFLLNWIFNKYANKIVAEMSYDLARQAFTLNSKTYSDHDTGTFVGRIVSDPGRILESLTNVLDSIFSILEYAVIFVYIFTLNIWIALFMLAYMSVALVLQWKRTKIRRQTRKEMFKAQDNVNSLMTEIVRSEKDIKSLGLEEKLSEVSKDSYENLTTKRYKFGIKNEVYSRFYNLLRDVCGTLVLVLGLILTDRGVITLATFMIVYSYRGQAFQLVSVLGSFANIFTDISVSHKRIFSLFDEQEFVTEKFGTLDFSIDGGAEVEFKNVGFSYKEFKYPNAKTDGEQEKISWKQKRQQRKEEKKNPPVKQLISENKVFENLSFKIERNTTVAFVGKSGSGKSTILDLMSKMYEVDEGQVLINGVNINEFSKEALRGNISLVNQFPYIFDMTIKENLLLASQNSTDEDIEEAIKKSALDEFIASLPNGIETKVGESGIKLSGGQRQRLAIARALLRKSSIIIFDESTSSLDNFAQNSVKKSIDNLKGTSTIVIVAHRLSTIKNVDNIFFLEDGKIVDEGSFEELFKRNKNFHAMFLAENV